MWSNDCIEIERARMSRRCIFNLSPNTSLTNFSNFQFSILLFPIFNQSIKLLKFMYFLSQIKNNWFYNFLFYFHWIGGEVRETLILWFWISGWCLNLVNTLPSWKLNFETFDEDGQWESGSTQLVPKEGHRSPSRHCPQVLFKSFVFALSFSDRLLVFLFWIVAASDFICHLFFLKFGFPLHWIFMMDNIFVPHFNYSLSRTN